MSSYERFSALLARDGLSADDISSIQENAQKLLAEIEGALENPGARLGLLFGQVQSGKTNNIIMAMAKAIDAGHRLFVVMTSDNTWLYGQTLGRIQAGLRSIAVFGKDDWRNEAMGSRIRMAYQSSAVVFVTTKNRTILDSLTAFVCGMAGHSDEAVIFDDEADQASLDTNQNRDDHAPSAINSSIQQLRSYFGQHVFVQVTATPQALFLQCASTGFRPDFVVPFHPGASYIGGEFFFGQEGVASPIRLIPDAEPEMIIEDQATPQGLAIPTGLRQALCAFFVASSAKYLRGDDEAFACLVHISHRQGVHQALQRLVNSFLVEMIEGLTAPGPLTPIILLYLKEAYNNYRSRVEEFPEFDDILGFIKSDMNSANVQILNSDNPELPQVRTTFNILIGGNRLGRGVTIGRLLVTYYGRSARAPQIDTVLQHARMYGYRRSDADALRFFTTEGLYETFGNIHESDRQLREMVFERTPNHLQAILLDRSHNTNLRPTRNNVVPLDQISLYLPGTRYFPYMPVSSNVDVLDMLLEGYAPKKGLSPVSIDFMLEVLNLARAEKLAGESWDDEAVRVCLRNLKSQHDNVGYLLVRLDRDIKQGARAMLSEDDSKIVNKAFPTLVMYRYLGTIEKGWDGRKLWVPNLRFPDGTRFFMYTPT